MCSRLGRVVGKERELLIESQFDRGSQRLGNQSLVKQRLRNLGGAAALAGALATMAGCSSNAGPGTDVNDPLEPLNRYILNLNDGVDTIILRPVAVAYRDLVPYPVQDAVHNFLTNLTEPVTLINQVLQGDIDAAGHTMGRFMTNSTLGLGGIFVIVDIDDQPGEREDFGQTLAVWGVGEGPYLVLPILGPSNARDVGGLVVDFFTDPFNIWSLRAGQSELRFYRSVGTAVDSRVRSIDTLDALEEDAVDFYARLRSAYRQRRDAQIENLGDQDSPFGPEPFDDFDNPFEDVDSP